MDVKYYSKWNSTISSHFHENVCSETFTVFIYQIIYALPNALLYLKNTDVASPKQEMLGVLIFV